MTKVNKRILTVLAIAIPYMVIVVILLLSVINNKEYPLDFTRQQNVLREPAVFHLDEPVDVEAIFINKTEKNVKFSGVIYWELVRPDVGSVFPAGSKVIQLGLNPTTNIGCKYFVFNNHAPARVKGITRELFALGETDVTWKITGDNVILVPQGGGAEPFNVDEFTYVPDEEKLPKFSIVKDNINCEQIQ